VKLFNLKKFQKLKIKKKRDNIVDPYLNIGSIIKESRTKKNLSLEDLSFLSKIPISTIFGIENNVKELIPPYPFTRSILLKLEECLSIEKLKLIKLIQKEYIPATKKSVKRNFTFTKIDLFNSWQGSFIYLFLIIISIFVLNSFYLNNRVIEFKYIEKTSS
tara:strand:- start:108 stop:590 length:483 start_codon:yes stop_codon:yes gene_type:complete